jgi:tetratricopeptide (TPR) repeat protein
MAIKQIEQLGKGLAVAALLCSSTAYAQDDWAAPADGSGAATDAWGTEGGEGWGDDGGFSFESEEGVTIATDATPVARYLQEGIQYYEREDYETASVFFYRVASEIDISADSLRPRGQFELAKTLVQMRIFQGALYWFDEIIAAGPTHPYFEASAPWLVVIARRVPGDVDMLRRVAAFADLFPDRIEEKYRDEMAYLLGQHYYNVGELEQSLRFLGFVTNVSTFYPKAVFLSGVTHVRLGDPSRAIDRFAELIALADRSRGDEELRQLGELARISLARSLYSMGEFDDSIAEYGRIRQSSEYWLPALFESAWGYFQIDQFNRALGNLHSLNSPFFNDEYYPEAPLLQAVILFYNCRFAEVRAAIDEFNYVYPPLREQLEETMSTLATNADHYEFVVSLSEQTERRFDARLQQIVNATLSDRSVRNALESLDQLDREIDVVNTADPGWANSELAQYLRSELAGTRERTVGMAGELVRNRLTAIRDELRQKERDAAAILVETDLAEADAISADLAGELATGSAGQTVETATREEMSWEFEGEYWKDELGYYYYDIESQCR